MYHIANDLKQQRELRCEKLEKQYEEQLDVQTADYLKKMKYVLSGDQSPHWLVSEFMYICI